MVSNNMLGIAGYAGCGKDTLALAMQEQRPGIDKLAFADPIRALMIRLDPMVSYDYNRDQPLHYTSALKKYGGYANTKARVHEVRRFMQELGTGARDLLDTWVWINALAARRDVTALTVITDVRFANEAMWIQSCGGQVIRLHRDGCVSDGHASEAQDFPVDAEFKNDGDIAALASEVLEYMGW